MPDISFSAKFDFADELARWLFRSRVIFSSRHEAEAHSVKLANTQIKRSVHIKREMTYPCFQMSGFHFKNGFWAIAIY